MPLFGHPRYFAGRGRIARYRENVLVALEVTPPHMRAFADELEAEGWQRLPDPRWRARIRRCS